jgi:hypothetical protein
MRAHEILKEVVNIEPGIDIKKLDPNKPDFKGRYLEALGWIGRNVEPEQLKKELLSYVKAHGGDPGAIADVGLHSFMAPGKLAWIVNHGGQLAPESVNFLNQKVKELEASAPAAAPEPEAEPEPAMTADARNKEVFGKLYGVIDSFIRHGNIELSQIRDLIKRMQPRPKVVRALAKELEEHINLVRGSGDKAALSRLSAVMNELKGWGAKVKALKVKDVTAKVGRKGRKADKDTGVAIPYLAHDKKYNISSVDPRKVPGAQGLLTFVPSNRVLNFYVADSDAGLGFKGKKLTGFDPKRSFAVRLRKPEKDLPKLDGVNIARMEKLRTSGTLKGKVNVPRPTMKDNIVLLKILK